MLPLGVRLSDLPLALKDALRWAASARFAGFELPVRLTAPGQPLDSHSARRHFIHYAGGLGLRVFAVDADGDAPRRGDRSDADRVADGIVSAAVAAIDLGATLVVTPPGDAGALAALCDAARVADRHGVRVAAMTRGGLLEPDGPQRIAEASDRVQFCVDTGELLLSGHDPAESVQRWAARLGLVHVRDARAGKAESPGHETVDGQGDLDRDALRAALAQVDYRGPLILVRTHAPAALRDLAAATHRWAAP